ncbi:MAG: VWA domain-containing protein [Balneolaceae bacterium]
MIWENSSYLWFLLLLPAVYTIYWWYRSYQKKKRSKHFNERLLRQLRKNYWQTGDKVRLYAILTAAFFFIIALAGPKIGTEVREIQRSGVNMLVALDLSRSMNAEDIRPSRLEKAKFEMNRLIRRLQGDRVGLLVFTGEAFVQSPLTTDYSTIRLFLDIANTDQMPTGSTNFSSAMRKAMETFETTEQQNDDAANVLLFISDGEDHGPDFQSALDVLTGHGVVVFSVGIGTREGATIPLYHPRNRNQVTGYQRDSDGNVVTSRLQSEVLQDIARRGGGDYYEIRSGSDNIEPFFAKLDELERGEFSSQEFADYKNQYQVLTILGLFFLISAFIFPDNKNGKSSLLTFFKRN